MTENPAVRSDSPPASLAPSDRAERIQSLDVLRGFALLGILVVNIQSFSMVSAAYLNPTAFGDLTGANLAVWLFTYALFDNKFMTIFSMLFGAGIVLMADRADYRGRSAPGLHYRRVFWLILFGLLHAHLLWYGDILFLYGICGLIVYWFRGLRPIRLLVVGIALLTCASAISLFFGWSMQYWPPEALTEFTQNWQPPKDMVDAELATYRGGWIGQMSHRVPNALGFETFILLIWGFWRAGGLMLVGMALFKHGVFSAKRSKRSYVACIAIGTFVGLPIVLYGACQNFAADWDVRYSFFYGTQFNYWGSILVSLGFVGSVMLLCQSRVLPGVRRSLAAVGQTALTNYLLQTIICTTIFYGHGFGLFGRIERVGQLGIVMVICSCQLCIAPLWLKHFRFGPFEWLWRCLTYMKWQPLLRAS